MCGIAGILYRSKDPNELKKICSRMIEKIKYRGPDEQVLKSHKNFSCGVARLSIEALKNGSQPVENDNYILGFNGEIFNYKQLIEENSLSSLQINSEAKLLLKLYEIKKEKFLINIKGQFAIFIYNKRSEEILLFRDRYGIRPLYYYFDKKGLIFASEIKSIVSSKIQHFDIDAESLKNTCFFWTNIGETTSIKNIYSLMPGHYLKYNLPIKKIYRYFNNPVLQNENLLQHEPINIESFIEILESAIRSQIHGEVGYACYLSGGIDSSILAYFLSKYSTKQLETFSVEFEDKRYDESDSQDLVSKYLGTKHRSIKISKSDISKNFEEVIDHCETILFRTAPVPLFLLSKFVNQSGHKVVYSGEGADEILLGYDIFFENRIRKFWSRNPDSNFRSELLKKLYYYLPQFKNSRYFNISKYFYRDSLTEQDDFFYSHLVRWSQFNQISACFNIESNKSHFIKKYKKLLPKDFRKFNLDRKAQYLEMDTLMSNYLLSSQGDRMSMAHSVEGRYPYLDEDFTKYCSSIKTNLLAKSIRSKDLLRKSFLNKLPDQIIYRPKIAYQAPEAKSFIDSTFTSEPAQELIENLNQLDLINKKNFQILLNKIKNPDFSETLGFRDNMSFIMALSYYFLKKKLKEWQY